MVRIRIASNWKEERALRRALAQGADEACLALKRVVGALSLELDGVDLAAGRAEGELLGGVETLGRAVRGLLDGSLRHQVHFSEGELEVILERRDEDARVTVVSSGHPGRVLAQNVKMDLLDLADACRQAIEELTADIARLCPSYATAPLHQLSLDLQATSPRPHALSAPPHRGPLYTPLAREGTPSCSFELRDEEELLRSFTGPGSDLGSLLAPGSVTLRIAQGSAFVVRGIPFLLLRDLAAFAAQIALAVRRQVKRAETSLAAPGRQATHHLVVEFATGTFSIDGGAPFPCPPLRLARALLESSVDFCGAVTARNLAQAENGWLAALRSDATERLAYIQELMAGDVLGQERRISAPIREGKPSRLSGAPLGPGRPRRLVFHRRWEASEVGSAAGFGLMTSLTPADRTVIAAGSEAVVCLDADTGLERWRHPGVTSASASGGVLFLLQPSSLIAADACTGEVRWSRARAALPAPLRDFTRAACGHLLALAPGQSFALDSATGQPLWSFSPPATLHLSATALGPLAVLGSDNGFLYALEATTGRLFWRVRLPGLLVSPPMIWNGVCVFSCVHALGGTLLALDPSTGRRAFELALDATPTDPPLPWDGLLAIAGTVAGDPVITALTPDGCLAWEAAPSLGPGAVTLSEISSGLLAKSSYGACVALDRDGAELWSRPAHALHPPPANLPALSARGLVLVPCEALEVLDSATGEELGTAPLPAPVRLTADDDLSAYGLDAGGVVTAVRLRVHLGVI